MPNFEDRSRKPGKRDESKDTSREGRRSPGQESGSGHSYGSPSSSERPERQPGSVREGGHEERPEERPGSSRQSPQTEQEEE